MKLLLKRAARIRHEAGEIVEVSPAEAGFLLSTGSAVYPPVKAEKPETPEVEKPETPEAEKPETQESAAGMETPEKAAKAERTTRKKK